VRIDRDIVRNVERLLLGITITQQEADRIKALVDSRVRR
jgi:hypothetical protein